MPKTLKKLKTDVLISSANLDPLLLIFHFLYCIEKDKILIINQDISD